MEQGNHGMPWAAQDPITANTTDRTNDQHHTHPCSVLKHLQRDQFNLRLNWWNALYRSLLDRLLLGSLCLRVVSLNESSNRKKNRHALCRCDCGRRKVVRVRDLKSGESAQCNAAPVANALLGTGCQTPTLLQCETWTLLAYRSQKNIVRLLNKNKLPCNNF